MCCRLQFAKRVNLHIGKTIMKIVKEQYYWRLFLCIQHSIVMWLWGF